MKQRQYTITCPVVATILADEPEEALEKFVETLEKAGCGVNEAALEIVDEQPNPVDTEGR